MSTTSAMQARRLVRYFLGIALAMTILYVSACLHILSQLDARSLVTHRIALPYSDTSPVTFPVARPIAELYWRVAGSAKVTSANQESNELVWYLSERMMQATERSEQLNSSAAQTLLEKLVCPKMSAAHSRFEVLAYMRDRKSVPLQKALESCPRVQS